MKKLFGKFLFFGGMLLTIAFFIRFAWIKEAAGQMFPTYITWLLVLVGAFVLVGFYIVGDYLFRD